MADDDWFSTGSDAAENALSKDDKKKEERKAAAEGELWRWWMKPGEEKFLTFVDGEEANGLQVPFIYQEHQQKIDGDYRNWFTCIDGMVTEEGKKLRCPLCQAGNNPYLAAAFTVIDHTEWTSKKGDKTGKDDLKLFVCKSQVLKMLRKQMKKKGGSLRGCKYEVTRTGDKTPNTGDVFDFEDKIELSDEVKVADYRMLMKPKSRKELLTIVGDVGGDGSEEEVKF